MQYPQGGTYNYSYDTLGRPSGMTEQQDRLVQWVKNVAYNQAGAMTAMSWLSVKGDTPGEDEYFTETRQYNVRLQLNRLRVTNYSGAAELDLEYRFSATQNNGRITQMKDYVSGEEVSYAYDSLNRLISAVTTGPQWGQSFSYDGFGNMAAQTVTKGTAPQWTLGINQATNRIVTNGFSYDANGNLTQMPNSTGFTDLTYDAENRLSQAVDPNASNRYEGYAYAVDNKRVYKRVQAGEGNKTEYVYFYGITGQKLATFRIEENPLRFTLPSTNLYFGGKLISKSSQAVVVDRLGSLGGATKYYPYGQERTTTTQDTEKFATYHRDATNLDYADQRYYTSAWGRFLTPDPYRASGGPADPQSWNRYAYVENDPANFHDPSGLLRAMPEGAPERYCYIDGARFSIEMCELIFGRPGGGGPVQPGPSLPPAPGDPVDAATNQQARGRLNERLANFASSNCAKVFDSVIEDYTTSDFVSYVETTQFYAARSPSFGNLTQNQVVGNGVQTTLNNSLPYGWDAKTIWGPAGNAVLLAPNYFSNTNQAFQQNTLLHELLHAYTHWNDHEIFEAFKDYGIKQVNPGAGDIFEWLKNDCKKPE